MAIDRWQMRRGTAAQWTSANPTLADGEPGFERDTGRIKVGDGVTQWVGLPYASPGPEGPPGSLQPDPDDEGFFMIGGV